MTDIVEWLREEAQGLAPIKRAVRMLKAADEIERLRDALREIVAEETEWGDTDAAHQRMAKTARAVLGENK